MFVSSFIQEYFYSTAGTYTVNVPAGSASVIFEMIGAGGNNPTPPSPLGGGQGGYISGTFTIPPATTSLKVVVGASGSTTTPSGASYINKVGATLFAMAGAGGAFDSAVAFGLNPGGNGGGGTFTSGIANGTNAYDLFLNPNGAFGGTTVGGLAGLDCSGVTPGTNGQNNPGTFEQALGGAGGSGNYAGGSGYTGGGSGCGGGGGSSYVNTTYTTVTTSYPGTTLPGTLLPLYGRENQSGYVYLKFDISNSVAIQANGDILCRSVYASGGTNSTISTMTTSTMFVSSLISSASGKLLLGTGTPTYRFEINGAQVSTNFTTGWRYGFGGGGANPGGAGITDNIQMKVQFGVWASILFATSDRRVKKDIQAMEKDRPLDILRQIKPMTYQYIDQINRHPYQEYGFIAQDVKPVLPHAVQQGVDFIPNIYDLAEVSTLTESTSMVVLRNKNTCDIEKGDVLKILDRNEQPIHVEVLDKEQNTITISTDLSQKLMNRTITEEDPSQQAQANTVFVYGKKVSDVQVVDKQSIFTVGIAAMQELDTILQQQNKTIAEQNRIIEELEKNLS